MQEIIAQNIEILEIPINHTNKRYYLPLSSRLINRKIKHIVSFAGSNLREWYTYTPSGNNLISVQTRQHCYLSIGSKTGIFAKDIPLYWLDVNNPYWIKFNREIEMKNSYISITGNFTIGGSVMLAFIYDLQEKSGVKEPNSVETVKYPLTYDTAPEILSLGRIEKLANKKISRIEIPNTGLSRACFLTLVTKDNNVLSDIPFSFFDGNSCPNRLWLDNIISEINFERSFIRISNKNFLKSNDVALLLNFFYNDQ
jgi:hypothetical protein